MGYNLAGRYCHCWNCGSHPLGEVIQLLTGLPWAEVKRVVGDLPRQAPARDLARTGRLVLPQGLGPLDTAHVDYIRARGFDPRTVLRRHRIRGIGQLGGVLRWRLFLPVTFRGETASWTTRSIVQGREPRYRAAKPEESAVPLRNLLYGVDACRQAVVVCEGPLDAWAVGPGGVALCGLHASPAQLRQLSEFAVRVVCFDGEPEAQRRARKLARDLSVFPGRTANVTLETGKDAAAASRGEIESLRREFL